MPYIGKEPARVPVTAADIPDDSITAAKILDGVITAADIGANAVDTSELVDDAVTADKLANSINTAIAANTAKVTNATHTGDVTGSGALTIAVDAVDIAMLSATGTASSTTFLRGDNTWDVPIGGVTSVNSVTGAVTATHLKTALENGIDSVHYVDGSIDNEHLADDAVGVAELSATGTASSSTFLRGDNAWVALSTDANTTTKGLYEHAHTISANYSITSGNNAITAGPITINTGIAVTVPTGSAWAIV